VDALRWQHAYVAGHGSPTAALILDAVLTDITTHGHLAALLPDPVRFGSLPGLRIMAAVHRLALERQAPLVAMYLPTLGGRRPQGAEREMEFRASVVQALAAHPEALHRSMARTPQTNETGRAALLRGALSHLGQRHPVRLLEIGASAGLNLRADFLPGIPGLEVGPLPVIVERTGCDLDPVDISTMDGRALLTSYVWVDDVDRYERLRQALSVADRVPATVVRMDAADFCAGLEPLPGVATVLWHSAMWLYLPPGTRARILAEVRRAGASATPDAPLAHVSWERHGRGDPTASFGLVARRWSGGEEDGEPWLLARGTSHGSAVVPVSPPERLASEPLD